MGGGWWVECGSSDGAGEDGLSGGGRLGCGRWRDGMEEVEVGWCVSGRVSNTHLFGKSMLSCVLWPG